MRSRRCLTTATVVLGSVLLAPGIEALADDPGPQIAQARPASATPSPEAGTFITTLADRAIAGLSDKTASRPDRESRFRALLTDGFDVPHIARFVLGRYWRVASEAERAEYLQLFEDFIVHSYSQRFGEYAGENLRVMHARATPDNEALVLTDLLRPSGPPVKVEWRLRRDGATFKITDVIVEGVSMSITQRDDFSATIQRSGGRVDALLGLLRDKLKTQIAN
jgi:phospholipid transport system substrate-binding protein